MAETPPPFARVWEDILDFVSKNNSIPTLVHKIKNDVVSIEHDRIKVKSERTGKIRVVPRSQFEFIWNSLVTNGFYISGAHKPYIHSQIICAILACALLDYVGVRYDPLTLYLKET